MKSQDNMGKWAAKRSTKPLTSNNRLKAAPFRYCKYCSQPIPKIQGLSVQKYSAKEFCCREHYMLFHRVIRFCAECGAEFAGYKSSKLEYCVACTSKKTESRRYKKKCSNASCAHLIHHPTIIKFGARSFCSLSCFAEFMGDRIKRCEKCNNPMFTLNGSFVDYNSHKRHQNCGKTIRFLRESEENAKMTYVDFQMSVIYDVGD